MTNLDNVLPVSDVESLDGLDLNALLDMHSMSDNLTLDTLLAVEYGHDLDEVDLDTLPNRLQNKEV